MFGSKRPTEPDQFRESFESEMRSYFAICGEDWLFPWTTFSHLAAATLLAISARSSGDSWPPGLSLPSALPGDPSGGGSNRVFPHLQTPAEPSPSVERLSQRRRGALTSASALRRTSSWRSKSAPQTGPGGILSGCERPPYLGPSSLPLPPSADAGRGSGRTTAGRGASRRGARRARDRRSRRARPATGRCSASRRSPRPSAARSPPMPRARACRSRSPTRRW